MAGQTLGTNLHLPTRSWFISDVKRRDLSETVELVVDPHDVNITIPVTVNTLQKVIGLLSNFARLSRLGRTLMLVPVAEHNYWLHKLSDENLNVKPENQTKICHFSRHARKNILYWRAMLVESINFPFPMDDFRILMRDQGATQLTIFTDASGALMNITDKNYAPTCLGVFSPHSIYSPDSTLKAFVLPFSFLAGHDQWGPVHQNTVLLELLPVLAELLHDPAKYHRRSLTVYTDNMGTVTVFRKQNSKKLYCAYFLEVLNYTLSALKCKLVMKWQKRRSSYAMEMADDATHACFDHVLPGTIAARHALPPPLQSVLLSTTSYASHTLSSLMKLVKNYLNNQLPDLSFPH